jgi:hypothetical protein
VRRRPPVDLDFWNGRVAGRVRLARGSAFEFVLAAPDPEVLIRGDREVQALRADGTRSAERFCFVDHLEAASVREEQGGIAIATGGQVAPGGDVVDA